MPWRPNVLITQVRGAGRLLEPRRLGARRRGEYGQVSIHGGEPRPDEPVKQLGEVVEVWAAADIVVRSRRLRLSADPFDALAALRGQLDGGGLELTLHPGSVARAQRRDSWQSGWQLRTALEGLSPSQRGTWRTLLVDATARPDRQRADGEPRRWQQYQGARCGDQRTMAEAISALLGGGVTTVLAPRRYPVTGRWARLDATAVLLDDLVDAARREPPDPPDRTGAAR